MSAFERAAEEMAAHRAEAHVKWTPFMPMVLVDRETGKALDDSDELIEQASVDLAVALRAMDLRRVLVDARMECLYHESDKDHDGEDVCERSLRRALLRDAPRTSVLGAG